MGNDRDIIVMMCICIVLAHFPEARPPSAMPESNALVTGTATFLHCLTALP